ncbi:TetR/AcrR family transcriptional regulator [Clostridium transplantifaecale]|uniref:TetR/AcrR family transcriptional regulator n=1 Tax=Clostridium transplantifaecale TaxID=2479838 RepID=UPI000F6433F6|nr:WHG domain-containing protein [Clostridium transplantifaecale]
MPPKVKADRDSILNAAFKVAKDKGLSAITAQSVSSELGTSVAPLFREFRTVEELRTAAAEKITLFHSQYLKEYPPEESVFLTYGLAYIHFAREYPRLFETIMQPRHSGLKEQKSVLPAFVVNCLADEGALGFEDAKELLFHIWIYTHGLACFAYNGSLTLTKEEEKELLITTFKAFLKH